MCEITSLDRLKPFHHRILLHLKNLVPLTMVRTSRKLEQELTPRIYRNIVLDDLNQQAFFDSLRDAMTKRLVDSKAVKNLDHVRTLSLMDQETANAFVETVQRWNITLGSKESGGKKKLFANVTHVKFGHFTVVGWKLCYEADSPRRGSIFDDEVSKGFLAQCTVPVQPFVNAIVQLTSLKTVCVEWSDGSEAEDPSYALSETLTLLVSRLQIEKISVHIDFSKEYDQFFFPHIKTNSFERKIDIEYTIVVPEGEWDAPLQECMRNIRKRDLIWQLDRCTSFVIDEKAKGGVERALDKTNCFPSDLLMDMVEEDFKRRWKYTKEGEYVCACQRPMATVAAREARKALNRGNDPLARDGPFSPVGNDLDGQGLQSELGSDSHSTTSTSTDAPAAKKRKTNPKRPGNL